MSDKDFIIIDEKEKEEEKSTPDTAAEDKAEVVQTEEKKDEKKEDDYEKICFICHRPESVTGKMVDLPNNITVCPDCMQKSFDAMTSGAIDLNRLMNMPGIQFLNMSDLENTIPKSQKIKKKKEKPKEYHKLDIKDIPDVYKRQGLDKAQFGSYADLPKK